MKSLSKLAASVLWYGRRQRHFGVEAYMNFSRRYTAEAEILEKVYGEVVFESDIGSMINDYVDWSDDRTLRSLIIEWLSE